ncbi:putative Protein white [Hypsibius exemplaris]|uniref:ABC-2 type transporter transmembrane domain-containing protein n=1 Tax=Hypsibius exemplaris TaxID=2072580 RepID=A0A9X6RNS7_HYPEX|nr:putative Protein white [Hypsibius exemplaris]
MDLIRNPRILRTRIIQKIILGLVYGLTFHGTVVLTQAGIQNANGAMLSLVIESSFRILLNIVQMYNAQLPILRRESGSFMYRPVAYYLALLISWFPVFLIDTTIFMSIAYFLMGLSMDATKFALTLAVSLAIANVSAAVGSFIAYICPSVGVGVAIAQQMQYIVMVFSGALYIALHSFPVYLGWLQYLSWIRYGFEAMSIIHWRDIGNISCTENFTETCRATGQIVLHSEDYLESRLGFDFYMLGVLFAGFHLAAFCSLILRLRRRNSG